MGDIIGRTAGDVWRFLKENSPATAAKIQKGIGVEATLTHQALGWLAREGKINIDRQKRSVRYSVTD